MRHTLFLLIFFVFSRSIHSHEQCRAFFSDTNTVVEALVSDIAQERYLVQIAVSRLSARKIVNALVAAKKRGVAVEVMVDNMTHRPHTAIVELFRHSIPVFLYRPSHYFMKKPHILHRFCVLSDRVWMGNFSLKKRLRQSFRESAVVISHGDVVDDFVKEFEYLKMHSCKRAIL